MRGKRFHVVRVQMRQVEINDRIFRAATFEFMHDGAGDDIARRQFASA